MQARRTYYKGNYSGSDNENDSDEEEVYKPVTVPINKVQIIYSRSSGPGGQNVNKVNTKVTLRFDLRFADWMSDKVKQRLIEQRRANVTAKEDDTKE